MDTVRLSWADRLTAVGMLGGLLLGIGSMFLSLRDTVADHGYQLKRHDELIHELKDIAKRLSQ